MPENREHHEIDDLLSRLDTIAAPDRWNAALDRDARPSPRLSTPSPLRRLVIASVAFAIAAAGIGLVVTEFRGGTTPPARGGGTISSSALVQEGTLRCTATLPATLVAGRDTGMRFTLTNVTDQPVKASFEDGRLGFVLAAADGTAYDSRFLLQHAFGTPFVFPTKIAPHTSVQRGGDDVLVRWGGPLALTPECLGTALPPLHVGVRANGAAPSQAAAIDRVVSASAGLLDACRPLQSGVPVRGQIDPPTGSSPSMQATCSITIKPQGGFSSAQVLIVSPPSLSGVSVKPPYDGFYVTGFGPRTTAEVVTWDFVVTQKGAIPVYSYLRAQWPQGSQNRPGPGAKLGGVEFTWTGSRWVQQGRGSRCGNDRNPLPGGSGGGGSGAGVDITITWLCP